mmetsp:Transcript_97702/g.276383  ORF Transcript_97702/g.276383 Transcript_97702/m.276383 type:complete len:268 (+) Transcript_97702:3-806(+)
MIVLRRALQGDLLPVPARAHPRLGQRGRGRRRHLSEACAHAPRRGHDPPTAAPPMGTVCVGSSVVVGFSSKGSGERHDSFGEFRAYTCAAPRPARCIGRGRGRGRGRHCSRDSSSRRSLRKPNEAVAEEEQPEVEQHDVMPGGPPSHGGPCADGSGTANSHACCGAPRPVRRRSPGVVVLREAERKLETLAKSALDADGGGAASPRFSRVGSPQIVRWRADKSAAGGRGKPQESSARAVQPAEEVDAAGRAFDTCSSPGSSLRGVCA